MQEVSDEWTQLKIEYRTLREIPVVYNNLFFQSYNFSQFGAKLDRNWCMRWNTVTKWTQFVSTAGSSSSNKGKRTVGGGYAPTFPNQALVWGTLFTSNLQST